MNLPKNQEFISQLGENQPANILSQCLKFLCFFFFDESTLKILVCNKLFHKFVKLFKLFKKISKIVSI